MLDQNEPVSPTVPNIALGSRESLLIAVVVLALTGSALCVLGMTFSGVWNGRIVLALLGAWVAVRAWREL